MGWATLRGLHVSWMLATAVVGAYASFLLAALDVERQESEQRSRIVAELAAVRARLEGTVKSTFSSTDGLVNLIAIQGGIDPHLFADMARLLLKQNRAIRNLTLAPDDTVRMVYPLAGNEKVLGFSFSSRPEQHRTVLLARSRKEPILAGPVELVQGGQALINRAPVFHSRPPVEASTYWGTVSIVARLDAIVAAADFPAAQGVLIALRGKDGQGASGEPIYGDAAIFSLSPVLMTVNVPGGTWQLGAIPAGGWSSNYWRQSPYLWFGVVVTLLSIFIVGLRDVHLREARARNRALELEMAERQKVEQALRDEESRFRTLFESSPDPAWIIEGNRFIECNHAAARILGYETPNAVMFVHPARLSPEFQPDGEPSFDKAERMLALARERGIHRFEWRHTRADGTSFPAEVTLSNIALQGRQVIYCAWRDISERKRAEKELQSSQSLLQAIIESAGAVIYVFDTDGRLILCNRQFEDVVGCKRLDVLGHTRHDFMPAAVAAEHEQNDRRVIASARRATFEEHNPETDGTHYYLTVKCPIFDGSAIRGVVGISTDITDRKRDEERLKLAATVLAATADGVMVTDTQGRIVSVNRAFVEITGYEEDEVRNRYPSILKSDRHGDEFYQAMWHALVEGGAWQGELWNRRKNGEIYPEWLTISAVRDESGNTTHYVAVFSDISLIKRSQDQLERLAHFDPLTDLPNRVLFHDRLTHAIDRARRYEHGVAVLLIDLDGFKTVNDSLGHPAGDRLLQLVAGRLRECIRVEDTVARLGGDEFAVILANLRDGADAVDVVRKLLATMQTPFDLDGFSALVTASIGIAVFPLDGETVTDLVRNADAAMYGAKEAGRNTYHFYRADMTHKAQERLQLEAALRRAIERQEFEVWYQPQLCLHSGRLVGAEALVRWRDPERGLVPPGEFIPLAERTGLILPIGELVLADVLAQGRRWVDAGLAFGRIAVNVAAPQIERGDFVEVLRAQLTQSGLPARYLEIEITESYIMENAAHAREALLAIQALGVTTAIDDFGTGYSSLAYLKELPIDTLKIDRAFVMGLPDAAKDATIARAIVAMAHSLGFKVTAEGVETEAQRSFLQAEGCDDFQGYLVGRPLPAAEFAAWIAACALAPATRREGKGIAQA